MTKNMRKSVKKTILEKQTQLFIGILGKSCYESFKTFEYIYLEI